MPDLNELDRAQAVKLAGANPSTGIADNFMEIDTAGRLTIKLNDASGSAINLGQGLMAASLPVTFASNQSALPVSQSGTWTTGRTWTLASGTDSISAVQSGTWNINNISGTISLPTGAATETTLSALNTKVTTTANGIKVDGSSVTQPVSGTFWQATQPVSAASLPLPTGAATSALQTSGNASLSSIDSKTPALGQALAAASVPVVLTAAQLSALTPLSAVSVTQSTSPWITKDQADGTIGSAVPSIAIQIAGKNNSGNLQAVSINREGLLNISTNSDKSVFGPLLVASRVQQLSADFSETLTNNNITQTVTGTGTVTLSNSNATISTGTGTTSSSQIATIGTIDYLPGREMYTQYTAAFTTPTSAASTQLTGLYNGNDGLLIGYNGLNFSIGTVAGGVSTFIASSSFNLDTLTGAATSLFTRAGIPEAVNFTYKNVYRIRAGWLGAAPIFFEIMSPDGNWVTFHIIRQPNSSLNPSFLEPSLPVAMLVTKTASDATNLKIVTTSWDAGIVDVSGQTDTSDSGTVTALNGAVVISVQSQSTIVADITGTWSGTLQVQGDVGDGSWNAIYAIDTNAVSSQTFTANKTIIIGCAGFNSVRIVATSWSSGTANINWNASQGVQAIIAQVVGNIASGQADTGNPIKVGGVYNSTLPVVSSGQRVDLQLDASGRLLTSTSVTTSLPAATFYNQRVITNGSTVYTVFTASQKLAIKQFYAGGTGIGKQALFSYAATNTLLLNSGDFETAGDITNWPYFSAGGSGTGTVALSTAHAFTGTHSAAVTFTTSDANHSNGLKQTFGTALDISNWRYITAEFFNTVSAGGAYTRTISIIITDSNASTRKFDVSGLSTSAPFNASNWVKITGEIANPTSSTGTNFDVTSVVSVELRMIDSATRAGTVYWDTAQLEAQLTPIFPIYHYQNTSFNIAIDPVFIMNIGDQILIAQTNNDSSKQEYFAFAGGVATS